MGALTIVIEEQTSLPDYTPPGHIAACAELYSTDRDETQYVGLFIPQVWFSDQTEDTQRKLCILLAGACLEMSNNAQNDRDKNPWRALAVQSQDVRTGWIDQAARVALKPLGQPQGEFFAWPHPGQASLQEIAESADSLRDSFELGEIASQHRHDGTQAQDTPGLGGQRKVKM